MYISITWFLIEWTEYFVISLSYNYTIDLKYWMELKGGNINMNPHDY